VLLAFVTSAEKSCVFPSNTELDCGVTFTMMEGGGGGGGGPVTAPPPPQPSKLTPAASRSATLRQWESPVKICRRGRTAWRKAVGGPRAFPPFPRGCEFLARNRKPVNAFIFYNIEVSSPLDLAFVHSCASLEALTEVLVRDSTTRIQFQIGTTRPSFSLYFVRPFAHYFFNFF
jgi:hypothetical protein